MNVPGLNGLLAQRQFAQQEQQGQLGQMTGLLGLQNAMQEQQLNPLKFEQMQIALANQKRNAAMVNSLLGQDGGSSGGVPMEGGISLPGSSGQIPQSNGGIPRNIQAMILSGDAGLGKLGGIMAENFKPTDKMREAIALGFQPGTPAFNSFVGRMATQGGIWDTNQNGGVSLSGGYAQGVGAVKDAEEAAKARLDIVRIPDGKGGEISLPRDIAIQILQGNRQNAPQPAPAPSMAPDPLAGRPAAEIAAIRQVQRASANGQPLTVNVPAPVSTSSVVGGGVGTTSPKLSDTLSPGQKAVDDAFAKDYTEFVTTGLQGSQVADSIKIDDAVKSLRSGSIKTGPMFGLQPESALAITNPDLANLKENVDSVVQKNLKVILGGAFTQQEGEALVKRAFNPSLSSGVNAYRLELLKKQIAAGLEAKQSAIKYYEEKGTLAGFKGKLYTADDFRSMSFDVKPSKQITLDNGSKVLAKFDEAAGKYAVTQNGKKYFVEGE